MKYSQNFFSDNLANENGNTKFLQATSKEEIANITPSLNFDETSDPYNIPYRTLFLLKNQILKQLLDLFNISFVSGVFPLVLKTAKVILVFKKESKLNYSNYRPIFLLSNVEKIIEKRMDKRLYTFLNNNNIIYSLQLGLGQQYFTSHALINMSENKVRKVLDDGKIDCGVFVDL